jgi:hypothetical protein
MHLSARSELKTGLAESRIETKLPINEGRLLHACFDRRERFRCGCPEMPIMHEGPLWPPVHMIKLTETREITRCRWGQPDEER